MSKSCCYFCYDEKKFLHTNDSPSDKEYNGWNVCFPCHNFIYHGKPSSSLVMRKTLVDFDNLVCNKCGTLKHRMYYSLGECIDCADVDHQNRIWEEKDQYAWDLIDRAVMVSKANGLEGDRDLLPCSIKKFVERYFESIPE